MTWKHWTFVVGVVLLSLFVGRVTMPYWSSEVVEISVTGKERAPSNKGGFYMVFSTEETLKNQDSFHYFKFNSSDLQGQLEVGKKYRVKVYGFRIPLFSKYRNIVSIQ